ncbi:MAG: hypothetical protein CMC04_07210 [Flavobacteriaceae bacterium]|nr:hypothetical protein [Flavobacteriaceae bacterium]
MTEKLGFIDELNKFQSFVFEQLDTNNINDFSNVINSRHSVKDNLAAKIQDIVMNSNEFEIFYSHIGWKKLAAKKLKTSFEDVNIILPHFRIDLPHKFKKDDKNMSLPWHQEATYFLNKANCSPKSIVMSTYLHDCKMNNGAILIGTDKTNDLIYHDEKYIDNINQRFFRLSCEEPKNYKIVETKYGETIFFDFLTPHKSGLNTSENTRLTFLLRASSNLDVKEWEKNKKV